VGSQFVLFLGAISELLPPDQLCHALKCVAPLSGRSSPVLNREIVNLGYPSIPGRSLRTLDPDLAHLYTVLATLDPRWRTGTDLLLFIFDSNGKGHLQLTVGYTDPK
jgi:hypothetical protein